MPRNMSFALTTKQFKERTKTVTRRFGWWFLKPGDIVQGVEKSMGLKKGEKIKKLGLIRVIDTKQEPLYFITPDDVKKEGFPHWTSQQFIKMMIDHYNVEPSVIVNRIEFEYLSTTPP